jgi:DegV family protein with EDD domain
MMQIVTLKFHKRSYKLLGKMDEIAIVVDGAIDLPDPLRKSHRVEVVMGTLRVDDEDLSDLSFEEIIEVIEKTGKLPRPGIPSPGKFLEVYERLGEEYPYIISFHTTSRISGMFNSARTAANLYRGPAKIITVDTGTSSLAAGLAIFETMRIGGKPEEISDRVKKIADKTGIIFYFPQVESLMRIRPIEGLKRILRGEVSLTDALKMLKLRGQGYLLTLKEGKIHLIETSRTPEEAKEKIVSSIEKETGGDIRYLAVGYLLRKEEAENLSGILKERFKVNPFLIRMSPMVMAGAGPDLWGTSFLKEN